MRRLVDILTARKLLIGVLALAIFGLIFLVSVLTAAPPLVTTELDNLNDDGECTLREAILQVNGVPATDDCAAGTNITFEADVDTIVLSDALGPLPELTADGITINGFNGIVKVAILGTALTDQPLRVEDGLTITSANNIISNLIIDGFPENGLVITGPGATGNQLTGMVIGSTTDSATGSGNGLNGILIADGAQNNLIGLASISNPIDRNIIVGNGQNGVEIRGDVVNDTSNNIVQANNIGVLLNFNADFNQGSAVLIHAGANNNTIGIAGATDNNRSVIAAAPGQSAIVITDAQSDGNQILGNYIGRDLGGVGDFPNLNGILITGGASNNTVAGDNTITNSTGSAIVINGASTNNTIDNNVLPANGTGIVITGAATGNTISNNTIRNSTTNGIVIAQNGTNNNVISANTVRNNGEDGIIVTDGATGNTITENVIRLNAQLGIDLGNDGVTANDAGDADVGPNNFQNFPDLLLAVDDGAATQLGGRIDGGGNQPFTVEAFSNAAGDPEGEIFQGSTTANNGGFTMTLANRVTPPQIISTTLTDSAGNTSEFSTVDISTLQAQFNATFQTDNTAPALVNLVNTSIVVVPGFTTVSYAWDFGNGDTSTQQNPPAELYNLPGTYTITLTICVTHNLVAGVVFCDTATLDITIVADPTDTPTNTSLPPDTLTPTDTLAVSPTATFTASATFTRTPLPTSTPSATRTATFTLTPSLTQTPTLTLTPTFTRTFTHTPSLTASNTNTATATFTLTPSATFTLTPSRTSTFTPVPTNTFTSTPLPTDTPQPTFTFTPLPSNTLAPAFTLTPEPEVTVIKEIEDEDTFTIIIDNPGEDLTNLVVEERLIPGVVYLSSVPGSPLCREQAGVITCLVGTLASGEKFEVDITVDADGVDIVSGQTSVRSDSFNTQLTDPYILKSSQPPFARPGETISYIIRVINPTQRTISRLRITDIMPDAIEIDSVSSVPAGVRQTGQNILLEIPSLAPGGRATITINGTLKVGAASPQIANRACFTTSDITRPRCAVAGFVRATALPATGETQRLPLIIGGIACLMALGTGIFFVAQRRKI